MPVLYHPTVPIAHSKPTASRAIGYLELHNKYMGFSAEILSEGCFYPTSAAFWASSHFFSSLEVHVENFSNPLSVFTTIYHNHNLAVLIPTSHPIR